MGATTIDIIEVITDAPESYDGFGSETLEWLPFGRAGAPGNAVSPSRHPYRRVAVRANAWAWQTSRYTSGLHRPLNSREELDQLVHSRAVLPFAGELPTIVRCIGCGSNIGNDRRAQDGTCGDCLDAELLETARVETAAPDIEYCDECGYTALGEDGDCAHCRRVEP